MHESPQVTFTGREIRAAAERGEYARAAVMASILAPGMEGVLGRFQTEMEAYERAKISANWHRALRALADARAAALASGVIELEAVVTRRLFDVVRLHHEERKQG